MDGKRASASPEPRTTVRPSSNSDAAAESTMLSLVDPPHPPQPGLGINLIPWRRPPIWAPFVDAVYAARNFLLPGTDEARTSRAVEGSQATEATNMPVAKPPAKTLPPSVEATPSSARLEAAVHKAASAKTKARDAKAALKKAKKIFRLARKAAKAARKEVNALQAAITDAEERAVAAAKRARTTRRTRKTELSSAAGSVPPRRPVTPKRARKTRPAGSSTRSDPDVVYTEPMATPSGTSDESPSATSS